MLIGESDGHEDRQRGSGPHHILGTCAGEYSGWRPGLNIDI